LVDQIPISQTKSANVEIENISNGNLNEETGEITTKILIPWLSVLSIGPQLMTRLKSQDPKDKIQLEIETISQVYTLAGDYPIEETTTIEL